MRMNVMKTTLTALFGSALVAGICPGQPAKVTSVLDGGGQRTSGSVTATVVNDGSLGGIGGISTASGAVTVTAKHDYVGQLYDVLAVAIDASPTSVGESGTRQLFAAAGMDDATALILAPSELDWSVLSGPLSGIDGAGLATAETVYEDTAAVAQGDYVGLTGTLGLTVLDTIPDNFGSYAGDGIDDDWQFQFFGLDNSDAAPLLDPDGDGQHNLYEFVAGLIPTDPFSRFSLSTGPVPGQPDQAQVVFDPIVADRTYTVVTSSDLVSGSWVPLIGGSASDNGDQRTVIDPSASGPRKFYSIKIEKP